MDFPRIGRIDPALSHRTGRRSQGASRCPWHFFFFPALYFLIVSACSTGFAQEYVKIGVATSLSTLDGRESQQAVMLAAEEINARGGVRVGDTMASLQVESVDLRDALPGVSTSEAIERFTKFVEESRSHAIVVGPFRSEVLLAGMDRIAGMKIPVLGTIAMSAASEAMIMGDEKYRNLFRVALNSKYLVDCLINTMKFLEGKFGYKKVFILYQDVAWARATSSLMIRLFFDRAGWEVVGLEVFPYGASDFSGALREAEKKGAQIILPIFDMPESGELVKQWYQMEIPSLLCGFISPMGGPEAWKKFEGQIAGVLSVVFELGNVPSQRYAPAARFYRAYLEKFGTEIEAGHGPAPAYESVYILKEAIEKAGGLEPEKLITALEETDRIGAMGRIRFHKGHQVIFGQCPESEALACVIQWMEEGRRKIVYPTSIAEAEIELPSFDRGK
jgi:branched-chain amino acid transport system substrate-binding protein